MKTSAIAALALLSCTAATTVLAAQGPVPTGIPHLDHVFVIMMENHGYVEVIGNPNTPFINQYAKSVNLATNYFAVAHPSLTNYLEVNGGSNFAILSDSSPDWHDNSCKPNLASGTIDNEAVGAPVCPISGTGTDAPTPAIDYTNETSGPPGDYSEDGKLSIPAATNISGLTIADQLTQHGMGWKAYEENLPLTGADRVDNSDGEYSNLTDFATIMPTLTPPLSYGDVVALYAVKHDPFVYFKTGQTKQALANVVGFQSLYTDIAAGKVANYSFIVPNQCNDQHGRSEGPGVSAFCNYDPVDNGTQASLNPALMKLGDIEVEKIVTAIHNSPVWTTGNTAIVLLWDENDYYPGIINKVVLTVDTNYGPHGVTTKSFYNHFSLLKSIEGGFGLPCLNHACDSDVNVMSELFSGE